MIKACIFDLDGTLLDTLRTIAHFGNKALKNFGIEEIPVEDYKILVGNGSKVLIKRMLKARGESEERYPEIHKWYMNEYESDFMYLTKAYDGIIPMLEKLKELGIKTAILSNKDDSTVKKVTEELLPEGIVDVCLGARQDKPLKPEPDSVFEIVEELGVARGECLYIGDTATDIETAKNAGICSVGVLWGFRSEEELRAAGADIIVSSPSEIVDAAIR